MSYLVSVLRSEGGRLEAIPRDEVLRVLATRGNLEWREDDAGRIQIRPQFDPPVGPLLFHQDGRITTRNPEPSTLQLMIDLAAELRARVRGDELETYRTPDETYVHPDDASEAELARERRARLVAQARFRPWLLRLRVVGICLGVVAAFYVCWR